MTEVHPTFDTAYYKILKVIGDKCKRTYDKVLFYVVNTFVGFDSSQCLCSRYHEIGEK